MNHLVVGLGGTGERLWRELVARRTGGAGEAARVVALLLDQGEPDRPSGRDETPQVQRLMLAATPAERQALRLGRPDLDRDEPRAQVRLLLAARHSEVLAALQRVRALSGGEPLCCHVLLQLGSATGAGLLIDLLGLLRLQLPAGTPICLHAQLPEPDTAGTTPWPAAQAQAAVLLQELQALADGAGWPGSLAGGDGTAALQGVPAFDRCWLSAAMDEDGLQPRDALQRLQHGAGWLQLLIDPPTPALAGLLAGSGPQRFAAAGHARVRCDARAIRTHLGHELLLRLLNQLRYQHWRPALGVVGHPSPLDRDVQVDEARLGAWGLSVEHLWLRAGMAEIDVPDQPEGQVEQQWQQLTAHALGLIEVVPPAQRAETLRRLMDEARDERFRGVGVQAAFDLPEHELQRRAVAVRQRIERTLWDDWRDRRRSLHGCGQLMARVLGWLDQQAQVLEEHRRGREMQALQLGQQADALMPASGRVRGGVWSLLGAGRAQDLKPLAFLLRDAALARTWALQAALALRFCVQLQVQLTTLQGMIDSSELALGALAQGVDRTAAAALPEPREATAADVLQADARLESRELLAEQRTRLVTGEAVLRPHLDTLWPMAFARWGDRPSFRALAQWLDEDASLPALLALCEARLPADAVQQVEQAAWARLGAAWQADPARRALDLDTLRRQAAVPMALQPGAIATVSEGRAWPQALAPEGPGAADDAEPAADVLLTWRVLTPATLAAWRRVQSLQQLLQAHRRGQGSAARALQLEPGRVWPDLVPPTEAQRQAHTRAVLLLADALGCIGPADPASAGSALVWVRRDGDGFEIERHPLGHDLGEAAAGQGSPVVDALHDTVLDTLLAHEPDADTLVRLRDTMLHRIDRLRPGWPAEGRDLESRAWNDAARTAMKILRQDMTP